jgi:energy-converting hydrogenase A subunit R
MRSSETIVCFDLEGPLTACDFGLELFHRHVPEGGRVFAILSRYDDVLLEERRSGHEPGDTMAIVLPFLAAHGVSHDDVIDLARESASTLAGARETVERCSTDGRSVYVVSASYAPFALAVGRLLSLDPARIRSTPLTPDVLAAFADRTSAARTLELTANLVAKFPSGDLMTGEWDEQIVDMLDSYFFALLPDLGAAHPVHHLQPLGGRRKARELERIGRQTGQSMSTMVYIGDSINDQAAMKCLTAVGGMPIAFNANHYALSEATSGVASTSVTSVLPVIDAWDADGEIAVRSFTTRDDLAAVGLDWLPGQTTAERRATIDRHRAMRTTVRAHAGNLG